ncbi:MAG: ATP-binding cassette domain-containing protein, partial [Proteobacteria bacterium]|nr:ATP-binding cassette domain-containing protein [Pseudomonadota bacterium]
KAAQAQSKLKKVEKLEQQLKTIQEDQRAVKPGRTLTFKLPAASRGDKMAVSCVDLEFSYAGESIWDKLNMQLYRGKKIALVAPNGAGKTTLIKLITGELKPSAGDIKVGGKTRIGYFSQHQSEILGMDNTVIDEIRRKADRDMTEEHLMGVLGLFLLGEKYFDRKVSALSGGEKNRLVLASLFLARANLLILDEPTNHLDLESRMGLVAALKDYDGTLLFVAHDRYLLTEVAEEIWELGRDGFTLYLDGFEQYDASRRSRLACRDKGGDDDLPGLDDGLPEPECAPKKLSKEEKRRIAEARNRLYRELKPLKTEYDKLEKDLDKAMDEQAVLEGKMNDPATYEKPEEAIRLNSEYKELGDWIESLLERMGVLEQKMEKINRKRTEMGID